MPVVTKPWIWDTPTEKPKLAWDQVHVWRICLNDAAPFLQRLISILSIDEKYRAKRYRFIGDRNHFIAARGVLRIILGSYLNMKPNKLRFSYGPYDKPLLVAQPDGHALQFNVSQSHGLGLCAVTRGRELGVDLEKIERQELPHHQVVEIGHPSHQPVAIRLGRVLDPPRSLGIQLDDADVGLLVRRNIGRDDEREIEQAADIVGHQETHQPALPTTETGRRSLLADLRR